MKKVLCCFLAVILCMSCAACGQNDKMTGNCEEQGHAEGDWEILNLDPVTAEGTFEKKCSRCGEVLDTKTEVLKSLAKDDVFLLTVDGFCERMENILKDRFEEELTTEFSVVNGVNTFIIKHDEKVIARFGLVDETVRLGDEVPDSFRRVLGVTYGYDFAGSLLETLVCTLLPSLSEEEMKELCTDIGQNSTIEEPIKKDGLYFAAFPFDQGVTFSAGIDTEED